MYNIDSASPSGIARSWMHAWVKGPYHVAMSQVPVMVSSFLIDPMHCIFPCNFSKASLHLCSHIIQILTLPNV